MDSKQKKRGFQGSKGKWLSSLKPKGAGGLRHFLNQWRERERKEAGSSHPYCFFSFFPINFRTFSIQTSVMGVSSILES